ncbi:hypothetical protein PVAG01_08401 [Phlyctema vagabunda]|uniref:Uncharacterized protein n=1 Tax=Phlyctema vagabunda TaxID=108571 RepID=A0ABR4P9P7_9HELO
MSNNRKSDDSLEKELAYEDALVAAAESSKRRRVKAKEERNEAEKKKEKDEEEERQAQMKQAVFQAGEHSRTRRGKR